ncbi:acyltransferase [Mesorhizobium abyssinicae]|uniref:acyltransferase family protein n=1 Tax=Mesorhizobium TaxID=68287 RepID=UPI0025B95BA4|nr:MULTISPECIES: acyltransferase [Mesorhizobium]MDX8434620.1 acyltransferase [Mesorhizobium abyssinicae]
MNRQDRDLFGLQILRAIAAIGVIVRHTLDMSDGSEAGRFSPAWLTAAGGAGVDLFFVISGFIMVYVSFPQGQPPDTPKRFIVKRATRIFPLYWICSATIAAISLIGFLRNMHIDSYTIFNSAFLLPGEKLIYVAWTLSYEIYFYIIFAVSLCFGRILPTSVSAIFMMIGGILIGREIQNSTLADFASSPLVLEFCFGIVLALSFSASRKWRVPAALGVLGFLIIIVSPIFVPHPGALPDATRVIAWGLPATLIVAAFLEVRRPQSKAGRAAVLLGDASYALYLTHVFVMIAYGWLIKSTLVGGMSQVVVAPVIIILCLIVGVLTHLFVERPVLDYVRKVTRRQPARWLLEARSQTPEIEAGSLSR